jgi:hypothetical protein
MMTVHKYKLEMPEDATDVRVMMPARSDFLHVAFQGQDAFIWASVDTTAPMVSYDFEVYATGQEQREERYTYLGHMGTFFTGPNVWHLFQRRVRE